VPTRRDVLKTAVIGAGLVLRPKHLQAVVQGSATTPLVLNDASGLNPVKVKRHLVVRPGDEAHTVEDLRALLKEAAQTGAPVASGGARHSMGGQSLPRDGIAISQAAPLCVPDPGRGLCRVSAGARWRDVIAVLDPLGLSVPVMQSNNDFSIGGTLCVNAHGWAVPFGPFGTTVRKFRLMLADGTIVTCSPEENQELFSAAIGGYGLFGIVLDIDIKLTENLLLAPTYTTMPTDRFAERFTNAARDPSVRMAYGRLAVAREALLEEALLVTYRPTEQTAERLPTAHVSGAYRFLAGRLFRAQIGSERAKKARWFAETVVLPRAAGTITRNALLNSPVSALAGTERGRTDILHEYFVPPSRLTAFVAACRKLIPEREPDLLNVTLRYLDPDPVSMLAFAPEPRIAAVMLFSQSTTSVAEATMRSMTEGLIDVVLTLGGSFYLPYRLHARRDQVRSAYPRIEDFLSRKRRYDSQLRFRNLMWDHYFA